MTDTRTAVIGTGYLGRYHAEKYAQLPGSRLVAVVDTDPSRASSVGAKWGVRALTDYRELEGQVDAVSVVVPTPQHFAVADFFLRRGVHVLVEKPMTTTVRDAERLIRSAKENRCVLQVGHLERFNGAVLAVRDRVRRPLFIEATRIAPFQPRGTEVSVVLDLMIHDIDIILSIVDAPLVDLHTIGVPVLTPEVDIANARLEFANGCVANVTASRVSNKTERRMRLFEADMYVSIDFQAKSVSIRRRRGSTIETEDLQSEENDALRAQIASFLNAVRTGAEPVVGGEDGKRALEAVLAISARLKPQQLAAAPR
jgi:predicted dehydrogenase